MIERYRILVSCPRAWDGLSEYEEMFAQHGIAVDVPAEVSQQLDEGALLSVIERYDGIIAGDDELTRKVMEAGPRLKVISKWGVGVDAIDLEAARELGIVVTNTPGMFGDELADYALGFLLMMARGQHRVDREIRSGHWPRVSGHSLAGRTLGIVGLGSSGSALATRAAALKMRVIANDPFLASDDNQAVPLVSFEEILEDSDIISLHLPGQPRARPVIDAAAIDAAKPGFWLINTARGSPVDETALVAGLKSGKVGAAALDVFQVEPIAADHPLLTLPNVILGSHNGSNTSAAVARTTRAAVDNLVRGLTGDSPPG